MDKKFWITMGATLVVTVIAGIVVHVITRKVKPLAEMKAKA